MKIITFNKADEVYYYVTVDEDCHRNRLSEIKFRKDSIDYSRLINKTLELWGIKDYHRFDDWSGTIIIEGSK